jgi:hypothetical protein
VKIDMAARWVLPLLLVGALLVVACAVIQPPPGGPEDKTPPSVVRTIPTADSAGVARDVAPDIIFSEKVDPASFKNTVLSYPPHEFDRLKVKGERLEIRFKGLLPETTMCLLLRPGIKDWHGVENKQNYLLYFSTARAINRGEISGVIFFKDKPDSAGVAELFAVRGDTALNLRTAPRARVSFAAKDGKFALRALPTNDSKFLLRAFSDRDGDARYSEGKEFATLWPDTITLAPLHERVEDIHITIIDPNEPGSVEGRVVNETHFKILPTVRLAPAKRGAHAIAARADSTGAFTLSRVPPGAYIFSAFIDVKADTLCGTYFEKGDTTRAIAEPCLTLPDTLRLKPGETKKLDPVTLK